MTSAETQNPFCGIAVMAKASQAGRTKTRLSPPLTLEEAALFNTAFLKDISANLLRVASEVSLRPAMAYGPPGETAFFQEHLPSEISLHEVWHPGFGNCLKSALEVQFAAGCKAACVLNSDSPTLPAEILIEAVRVLEQPESEVVFGPSNDGGYYFLGCKTIHPRLFEDITWSTASVAGETLARAAEIGVSVHMLPEWYDIDDAAALHTFRGEVLSGQPFNENFKSSPASHSSALLQQLLQTTDFEQRLQTFGGNPDAQSLPVSKTRRGVAA